MELSSNKVMELQWEVRQVAEIYICKIMTNFENSQRIYERFVDDIVSIIKRENLVQFHNHMNALHPKIQFTIEEENNGKLPF